MFEIVQCQTCKQIIWNGSHLHRVLMFIKQLFLFGLQWENLERRLWPKFSQCLKCITFFSYWLLKAYFDFGIIKSKIFFSLILTKITCWNILSVRWALLALSYILQILYIFYAVSSYSTAYNTFYGNWTIISMII